MKWVLMTVDETPLICSWVMMQMLRDPLVDKVFRKHRKTLERIFVVSAPCSTSN